MAKIISYEDREDALLEIPDALAELLLKEDLIHKSDDGHYSINTDGGGDLSYADAYTLLRITVRFLSNESVQQNQPIRGPLSTPHSNRP